MKITFKRFAGDFDTRQVKLVKTLKEFAKAALKPYFLIDYNGDELEYKGKFLAGKGMSLHYQGRYTTVDVRMLKDSKKPYEIVYVPYDGDAEHLVLDDRDFVKSVLGDLDKNKSLKKLLEMYQKVIHYTGDHDVSEVDETPGYFKSLIQCIKKIGINWPELAAIEKSMKSSILEALEIPKAFTKEEYRRFISKVAADSKIPKSHTTFEGVPFIITSHTDDLLCYESATSPRVSIDLYRNDRYKVFCAYDCILTGARRTVQKGKITLIDPKIYLEEYLGLSRYGFEYKHVIKELLLQYKRITNEGDDLIPLGESVEADFKLACEAAIELGFDGSELRAIQKSINHGS